MEALRPPLSSRLPRRAVGPERRDLRFYGPVVGMFFDGAKPNEGEDKPFEPEPFKKYKASK